MELPARWFNSRTFLLILSLSFPNSLNINSRKLLFSKIPSPPYHKAHGGSRDVRWRWNREKHVLLLIENLIIFKKKRKEEDGNEQFISCWMPSSPVLVILNNLVCRLTLRGLIMEPTKPILVAPSPPLVGWVDLCPPLGLGLCFRWSGVNHIKDYHF